MTMLSLFVRRQAMVTFSSSRRLTVLFILLLIILAAGILLLAETVPQVSYSGNGVAKVPIIVPNEAEACIGGTISFPLIAFVDAEQVPDQINVAESWCLAGLEGACFGVIPASPNLPLLEPKRITTSAATRPVPETLKPGVYHFWHSATDASGAVSGYIVAPITVNHCP